MTTQQTPCQAGDAEDWFIERDGLQYPDQPFGATPEEIADLIASRPGWFDLKDAEQHATKYIIAAKRRDALIRRRQAKQACFSCRMRLPCLSIALEQRPNYGTYGGYYPEELRQIHAERDRRRDGVD